MNRPSVKSNSITTLFGTRTSRAWAPAWRYHAAALLWLMKLSSRGHIVLEIRDPEARRASFSCLQEEDGSPLWENLTFPEPWWIGIEDLHNGTVFFHRYRKPDMPQHIGIMAVDMATGTMLWELPDYSFLFALGDEVYASKQRFDKQVHVSLDIRTGEVRTELGTDPTVLHPLRSALNEEDRFADYRYPAFFDESHPLYSEHRELVYRQVKQDKVRGHIDVLFHSPLLLLSWNEVAGYDEGLRQQLSQHFLAYDIRRGLVVYSDIINRDHHHAGVDSFFMKGRQVLYVRNGTELVAHHLPAQP